MRMSEPSVSTAVYGKLLENLAAAFKAFRRVNKPGRWIPSGLRNQAVAALNAGVPSGAIERTCKVSRAQLSYWRAAANVVPQPRVLSVVDDSRPVQSSSETGIELRVGAWCINLSRATD
jgi:hypothetical protein